MSGKNDDQDHYTILNLSFTDKPLNEKTLKLAYRRSLLLHHPDKSNLASESKTSIDQITIAYKTLADPVSRSEYDRLRALRLSDITSGIEKSHPGLETVDLDDLSYDTHQGTWYRSCRCGKDRAFVTTEKDLEANAEYGEILIGCEGCSLWLRVTFAVDDDG